MTPQHEPLDFRGGSAASLLPLAVFLVATVVLVLRGAPAVEGMILAAMLGISVGMLFARDVAAYGERVFTLMANRIATVAVVCWLWAGGFAGILADSGLVEAIVWVGWKLDLGGALFTAAVFVSAAVFAVSVGTGLGTVVGFTGVMYPAGVVLGADPAALMGAIFSGAALGDNLAPISDTTIVSAATQETDVPGVVRTRLRYVLPTAAIAVVLFLVLGGGPEAGPRAEADALLSATADPKGLPMLIPAVVVFAVALSGRHFLAALTAGIAAAVVIGVANGNFEPGRVFHTTADGRVAGSIVSGVVGLIPTAILVLLMVTAFGIMQAGGFLEALMERLDRGIARGVRGTEAAIVALIAVANVGVPVNTVAMITVGPLANALRRRHSLSPYRVANLLDTVSCTFPYVLPYSATIVAAIAVQRDVAARYDFVGIVPWHQVATHFFYGIVLLPLMIGAVVTGWGRERG